MRIIHVYKDYNPIFGGIENHIQWLAEAQVAKGHRTEVLVTNPSDLPGRETINGVDVTRVGRLATVASTPLSLMFPLILANRKPDITHLQFPYPVGEVSQLFAQLVSRKKRPFVISYQADITKQKNILKVYRPILQRVLKAADLILAASPQYIQSSPFLKPLEHKCRVVPLGIDPAEFEEATPLIPRENDRPRILFMGRHRYYKGVDTLIRAMADVPDADLLIGGRGPETDNWQALTAELGLGTQIKFLGDIPYKDLGGLYQSADIFCLPSNSRAEAFGIVQLEAMAAGLPCVTTELQTGTSFIVQNEETGFVVPPVDPSALASVLNKLVADPELRQKFGAAGRARMKQEFTVGVMADRVEKIYEEVLGGSAGTQHAASVRAE